MHEDRKEYVKRFKLPHFNKVAEVMIGEPAEDFKARVHRLILNEKQEKANADFNTRKAERLRKKLIESRQKQVEKARKKAERIKKKMEEARKRRLEAERVTPEGEVPPPIEDMTEMDAEGMDDDEDEDEEDDSKPDGDEEEPPVVELTSAELKEWFRKPGQTGDLSSQALNTFFTKFTLPEDIEGFDEIRYSWQRAPDCETYLRKWMLEHKVTTRVEDLQPSDWFKEKWQAWQRDLQSWHVRHMEYKDPNKRAQLIAAKKAQNIDGNEENRNPQHGGVKANEMKQEIAPEKDNDKDRDVEEQKAKDTNGQKEKAQEDVNQEAKNGDENKHDDEQKEQDTDEHNKEDNKHASENDNHKENDVEKEEKAVDMDLATEGEGVEERSQDKNKPMEDVQENNKDEDKENEVNPNEQDKDTTRGKEEKEKEKKSDDDLLDPLKLLEEEMEREDMDVFAVEDVGDVGTGEPLFSSFAFEDWAMLSLRFELHLLVHAFRHDCNDPERYGIHPDHLAFYYNKYYKKGLNPKNYGVENVEHLLELIKDTVVFSTNLKVVESQLTDDLESNEVFVKLTEENRRDRQRRVDAGDDTAILKFTSRPGEGGLMSLSARTAVRPGGNVFNQGGAGTIVPPGLQRPFQAPNRGFLQQQWYARGVYGMRANPMAQQRAMLGAYPQATGVDQNALAWQAAAAAAGGDPNNLAWQACVQQAAAGGDPNSMAWQAAAGDPNSLAWQAWRGYGR